MSSLIAKAPIFFNAIVTILSAVITATGPPVDGENYSLACDTNGDKLSKVSDTQFQWDRVGGSINISQSATLRFSPLNHSNDSEYRCTATITSPSLLTGSHSVSTTRRVTVIRKSLLWFNYSYFIACISGPMPGSVNQLGILQTTATTIILYWNVSGNMFQVTYNYTVSGCVASQGNIVYNISDRNVRAHILENLSEDSIYMITVTAISSDGSTMYTIATNTNTSSMSMIVYKHMLLILNVTTLTGASRGPSTLTVTPGVTNISIQWNEVDCVERNGEITGYSVRYGQSSSTSKKTIRINGTNAESRKFSIDELLIRTSYSFEVAAVNSHGVGVYSPVVQGITAIPTSMQHAL